MSKNNKRYTDYKSKWYLKNRERILLKRKEDSVHYSEQRLKNYHKNKHKTNERRKKKQHCFICGSYIAKNSFCKHKQSWKCITQRLLLKKALMITASHFTFIFSHN